MRSFVLVVAVVVGVLIPTPHFADAKSNVSKKNDYSSLRVGPLRVNERDEGTPENVTDNNVSYGGIFGGSTTGLHYLQIGARSIGFGGQVGDVELRLPSATFESMVSSRKGKLRIINSVLGDPGFERDDLPTGVAFLFVDYQSTKDGVRTTAQLQRDPFENSTFAKGKVKFKRVAHTSESSTDDRGRQIITRTSRFLCTVKAQVRDLQINDRNLDTSEDTLRVLKSAKVRGKLLITLTDESLVL